MYFRFKDGVEFELDGNDGILRSPDIPGLRHVDATDAEVLKELRGCTAYLDALTLSIAMQRDEADGAEKEVAILSQAANILQKYLVEGYVERDLEQESRAGDNTGFTFGQIGPSSISN